jgi:uncharacterized protein (DUF2235 family)
MNKRIVICLDGTNNQYDANNTNVVKLYGMLDRTDADQLAYYQPGIGTMAPAGIWWKFQRWFTTRLDLAIAWLLEDHVSSAYRFLMRYYEEGDRIYIFGFSRGAYTARVLAAMLFKVGLLGKGNEELIPFAWDIFKRKYGDDIYKGFRHTFGRKVEVTFLGLWDTVSSVGWASNPVHFQFTKDNPIVRTVRHAMALDERRAYFWQNLWTTATEAGLDAVQVWFPGVHCDVGGGYVEAEAGLSKIALEWMVREAATAGLTFNPVAKAAIIPPTTTKDSAAPDPLAMKHESLRGWWWIAEFVPKQFKDPKQGFALRWILPLGRPRIIDAGARIHVSVFTRKAGGVGYAPSNIPDVYAESQ